MAGFANVGRGTQADTRTTLDPRSFSDYVAVVEQGLPKHEVARMQEAYDCLRYSQGHFDDCEAEQAGGKTILARSDSWSIGGTSNGDGVDTRWLSGDVRLSQPVMRRIVEKLSENLYKRSPTRKLPDAGATKTLEQIYKRQNMGAKWQKADAYTVVGGASAYQFAGLETESDPLRINLWSADQFSVFPSADDPEKVDAVVTIDKRDGRSHATLWTEERVATFVTKRDETIAGQDREFTLLTNVDNPYRMPASAADQGRGIIPFSFSHFDFPATEFTWDSPGSNLKMLNAYLNFGFDDLADGVRYLTKPIGIAEGVDEKWESPRIVRPGIFLRMPPSAMDAGANGPTATLRFAEPNNAFVATIWSHLNSYLDVSLEMVGLPPSTVRMILDARSGVSILAEQAPLLGWTEHRRRAFSLYEERAASTALRVLAAHYRNHGLDAKRFDEAAADMQLSLMWPRLFVDLPGPERDRQDGVRIQWGSASLIDVVQERDDCTREQALDKLTRVKADNDELRALGIDPIPVSLQAIAVNAGGTPGLPRTRGMDALASGPKSGIAGEPVDANAQADAMSQEGG